MRALALCAGCVLGGLATVAVQAFAASELPLVAPDPRATDSPEAPGELTHLRDEVARLRQELGLDPTLRSAAASTAPSASSAQKPPTAALPEVAAGVDHLLQDLAVLLQSGELRRHYLGQPEELASLVMKAWLAAGQPERALQLLLQSPVEGLDQGMITDLGSALLARGNRDGARDAFLAGLRLDPANWGAVAELARLDPAAGLALLDEQNATRLDDPSAIQAADWQRAAFLIAARRGAEARELLERLHGVQLDSDGSSPPDLDVLLAEYEPKLALELFDRRLTKDAGALDIQFHRAKALQNQGKRTEALAALRTLLAAEPDSEPCWQLLAGIDRNEALRLATSEAQRTPSATTMLRQAELLRSLERSEEAAAVFEQAWQLDARATSYPMLSADAPRWSPRILQLAREARDDELLGEVGDHAWRRGSRDEAIALWREALAVDPHDSEWREKVRQAVRGGNPLPE